MSRRPQGEQGEGQGRDKKKKVVPPSENELVKQQIMELDEEEIEHRRQLDLKYRDRAKERRDVALGGEDQDFDNFDDENLVVEDGDREYHTTTKGLDLDLFIKQKEKERAELLAAKQDSGKMQLENAAVDEKTKSSKKIAAKTNLGINIQRILFKDSKREGQRNIFKSGNCYEFDLDLNFGSNLPKLVIRSREKNMEEETPVSVEISDRIHEKLGKIMTYIKTGKKPEPKKDINAESQFQKAMAGQANTISTHNLSDDSDEDAIFPDAKKKLKTENGPKTAGLVGKGDVIDERNDVMMKGLFSSLRSHGDDSDKIEIETEDQTTLYNKMIQEKNKKLIAEMAQKRAEEKLAQLQAKDNDYYTECFPEDAPELEDLKNDQKRMDSRGGPGGRGGRGGGKSKKKALGKQFDQVSKAMEEKRKSGRGGD